MAQLFNIKKVVVGPRNLDAEVELAPNAPIMTSEDAEGTARVVELIPELVDHVCLGDSSEHFGEVVESTELAHLLEHVAVELLARTDVAGDVSTGQTIELGERTWRVTLGCVDDVLVAGALSSAAWILQWAYSGGGEPEPDVDAIAKGLVDLVASLDDTADKPSDVSNEAGDSGLDSASEPSQVEDAQDPSPSLQDNMGAVDVASGEDVAAAPEPVESAEPAAPAPERTLWDMSDVPAPHSIR